MLPVKIKIASTHRFANKTDDSQARKSLRRFQGFSEVAKQRRADEADRDSLARHPIGQAGCSFSNFERKKRGAVQHSKQRVDDGIGSGRSQKADLILLMNMI